MTYTKKELARLAGKHWNTIDKWIRGMKIKYIAHTYSIRECDARKISDKYGFTLNK